MRLGTVLGWLSNEVSNGHMFCGASPAFVMANRRNNECDAACPQGADTLQQLPNVAAIKP